jgi:quercetin dioxygenase-like cupin family protein
MSRLTAGITLALVLLSPFTGPPPGQAHTPPADTTGAKVRVAFRHRLPPLDGGHLTTALVEVRYGPGGSSAPHHHPCPVVGYVVEGALRTRVQGEPEAIYHAGESFYEAPGTPHLVSANASTTAPVTFLAWFVCDRATPLSVRESPTPGEH